MTFSYNPPPTNDIDRVRFWSGDTKETPQSVSNEDIAYLLSSDVHNGNIALVAADVATRVGDAWAAIQSTNSKSVGPLSISKSSGENVASAWYRLAEKLRNGLIPGTGGISAGGALFTGNPEPVFEKGLMDNGGISEWDRRYGR